MSTSHTRERLAREAAGFNTAVTHRPATVVVGPAGTFHALANAGPADVRFLNVHAPGDFDRRIGLDPPATGSVPQVRKMPA